MSKDKCGTCRKPEYKHDGCSYVTCPNRKVISAAPKDDVAPYSVVLHGNINRRPLLSDEEKEPGEDY